MPKCDFVLVASALFLASLAASFFIALNTPYAYGSATIWTDKPDYAPWETVTIYGSGFNPNTNILLTITRPDLVVETPSTLSSSSGNFVYYYVLNGMLGTYTVTATDGTNIATTTFTEAVHVDFKQYANDLDLWIGSILQSGKSTYYECMSVPQRVIFVDIASTSGDVHTLTLSHQATKGGIHAYDWLTGWNQGNVPPLGYTPWGDEIGPHATTAICQALHAKTAPYEIYVDVPDDPFISKDGSTQARINAYEAAWGNRQIRICGNHPFTSAGFSAMSHDVANSADTGDSYILYTLTWTSASDEILIELSGHLAMSRDPVVNPIAWGVGLGASQIAGGPYHFKLDELDGHSLGSQDNQIKGADILIEGKGKITVVKDAVPDDPEVFSYSGDLGAFTLDDDGVGDNFKDFLNVVPGSYTVIEGPETWWTLASIVVTGDTDGGSTVNLGARTATLDVDPGEQIVVTFTNNGFGKVTIVKDAVPNDPEDFHFTTDLGAAFDLDDDADATLSNTKVCLNVAPGEHTVVEGTELWWTLASIGITGDDDYSSGVIGTRTATIYVDPGEDITITFTNTKIVTPVGKIIIDKVTIPSADPQSFGFTLTGGPDSISQSFSLTDTAAPHDSGWIKPGTYAVSETVPVGWVLTSAVCSDGSSVSNIILDPSETVIVTFTDTKSGIPVGGEWVSIDKTGLLLPWVVSASLMAVTMISFVSVKRIRKRRN